MADLPQKRAATDGAKGARTAGWYVLLLAWLVFAAAFFAFSKALVKDAPDVTNADLLDIAHKFGALFGLAFGLLSFLASGLVYLVVRLIIKRPSRAAACLLTMLAYAPWLLFGWDLVYREKRYAEVARAIITYLGAPMLYAAAIVCGLALLGFVLSLVLKKRAK